jgi:hypothetical protein
MTSLRELNRATLARQMLLAREKVPATRAIERLVGVQAQWPKPPFIGLWSRVTGFEREQLAKLYQQRKLVRATTMRCTLHTMSAADYRTFRPPLQSVLTRAMTSVLRDRMKAIDVPKLVQAARDHFGAAPCTFGELRAALARRFPKADERAMGYIARTQLPLVMVPTGDRWSFPADSQFTLADDWLDATIASGEAEPDELVLRYLAAYGPATIADAQSWLGFAGLRPVFDRLRDRLITLEDERGREHFDLPKAPRPKADMPAPVRLLPEFDGVVVSRNDARVVPEKHRKKVFLSGLRVAPVFLVDGFAAGTWKHDKGKIALAPFEPLQRQIREQVEAEADALLGLLEAAPG